MYNFTNILWKKKTKFFCINKKSNLIGNYIILDNEVKPGEYVNLQIHYEMLNDINPNQKIFYSSFKLLDENEKQIGKIHIFKINII